jgi:hypothetical protein
MTSEQPVIQVLSIRRHMYEMPTRTKPLARRTLARMANPSIVGVADVVWVTEKGDSCDPSTADDAGGTPGSKVHAKSLKNINRPVSLSCSFAGRRP